MAVSDAVVVASTTVVLLALLDWDPELVPVPVSETLSEEVREGKLVLEALGDGVLVSEVELGADTVGVAVTDGELVVPRGDTVIDWVAEGEVDTVAVVVMDMVGDGDGDTSTSHT